MALKDLRPARSDAISATACCAAFSGLSPESEQDMGWYLKKSFPFGPLRINLSKSGIGASVGVKGLRISTGPKGKQINAGRGGLYYRASLNPRSYPIVSPPESLELEPEVIKNSVSQPEKNGLAQFIRGFFRGLANGR